MDPLAHPFLLFWLGVVGIVVFAASATIWIAMFVCWWMRWPVIRYQPRRPVPWGGEHVLVVVILYLALVGVAHVVLRYALPSEVAKQEKVEMAGAADSATKKSTPTTTLHPVVRLVLAARDNPWVFLAAFLAAVVVAPLVEEFFFRVLLQGWLEASERRHRRRLRLLWRILPGAGPIVLASLIFGGVHFRLGTAVEPTPRPVVVVTLWAADATCKLLALIYIIFLLRAHRGATATDFGWAPTKLASDLGLGLAAFVAILPLLYMSAYFAQRAIDHVFGANRVSADPLAMFFFALVLGAIYYRTHRIAPSTVTHAALNAAAMAMLFLRVA